LKSRLEEQKKELDKKQKKIDEFVRTNGTLRREKRAVQAKLIDLEHSVGTGTAKLKVP